LGYYYWRTRTISAPITGILRHGIVVFAVHGELSSLPFGRIAGALSRVVHNDLVKKARRGEVPFGGSPPSRRNRGRIKERVYNIVVLGCFAVPVVPFLAILSDTYQQPSWQKKQMRRRRLLLSSPSPPQITSSYDRFAERSCYNQVARGKSHAIGCCLGT
jgi:hypothetical protein